MKCSALILSVLLMTSASVFAEEGAEGFEKRKTEALSELDERIQKLQEHKTCVSGATDHEALKKCRASMVEFHHSQKSERMEKRKAHLEERMKRIQEKKAK